MGYETVCAFFVPAVSLGFAHDSGLKRIGAKTTTSPTGLPSLAGYTGTVQSSLKNSRYRRNRRFRRDVFVL